MKFLILTLLVCVQSVSAHTPAFTKRFVQIRTGRKLYVEHRPAAAGRPTLFLLNGLTYSTKQWDLLVTALDQIDPHIGLVLYDMVGMGETLLANAPANYEIPFDDQIQDLKDLHTVLKIPGPTFLAGLSYGGGMVLDYLALYPDDFTQFIAMSPFLARLPEQDKWIKDKVEWNHILYPFDPRSDEELYNWYLQVLINSTYPAAEPIILENPFKLEAVYRMVKGALNWNAVAVAPGFKGAKLHLMSGEADAYVPLASQLEFWQKVPPAAHLSAIIIKAAPHKLPEALPVFTARWLMQILNGNSDLQKGLIFNGDPQQGNARSGPITIPLSK